MNNLTIITSAAAILFAAQAPSHAISTADDEPVVVTGQPEEAVPTRRVSFADLNLASTAGQKTLDRRVGGAVRSVCLEATGPNPLDWAEYACRADAWRGAKPQMARAIERAQQLAANGSSSIAPVAITISVSSR